MHEQRQHPNIHSLQWRMQGSCGPYTPELLVLMHQEFQVAVSIGSFVYLVTRQRGLFASLFPEMRFDFQAAIDC